MVSKLESMLPCSRYISVASTLRNSRSAKPITFVIYLDDQYAIEYDCKEELGVTNYCVHIMSRSLNTPEDRLEALKTYAIGLQLNPRNLPFQRTEQITYKNFLSIE